MISMSAGFGHRKCNLVGRETILYRFSFVKGMGDMGDMGETGDIQPQNLPVEILKQKQAINLYLIAVFALAVVVVVIPIASSLVALWHGTLPPELWTGWNVCIGGLIALIGAQGTANA